MLAAISRIPLPFVNNQPRSDKTRNGALADSNSVMADQTTHHVVNSDRSTGEPSSVDAHAKQIHSASSNEHYQTPLDTTAAALKASTNFSTDTDTATANVPSDDHSGSNSKTSSDLPAGDATSTIDQKSNGVQHLAVNGGQDGGHFAEDAVGSDTDTSRTGSIDQSKEENRHVRSSSVKKPISFKSVSITKTFLAKTAGAVVVAPPAPKVGAKSPVPATVQPVAKPRLVAKSGSGMRDIPRVHSHDGTGAPDGRMVWNKNQPVPLPPPKQFTDEELKQQYGIHLTSRLQEDDGKSKWADEDEDEEDWAPEAVEWMDGTKSTINAAEQQATATPEPPALAPTPAPPTAIATAATPVKPAEIPKAPDEQASTPPPPTVAQTPMTKPGLTTIKKPTAPPATTTTKTILRPGAALQKQGGLGSAADKQTLISKATPPAAIKSPWASLPPVEKVPLPVVNPPTTQQQPSRFQRDPHGFDSFNNHPEPAREIAADTFDRSTWRENERSNRELFNSQSGRYEPAPEYRRGSRQQDTFKQPAVLQRGTHQMGSSPAEPSAAFQTRSSAQMDGSSYSRRRGSSVSGGNVFPRDRRMSAAKAPELPLNQDDTRNAVEVSTDVEQPPPVATQLVQPEPVPAPTQPVEQVTPVTSLEDEIARQKKVLQESREAAKRRKQEEWEREEAEKKERIRKRLEALSEQETTRTPPASVQTQPNHETTIEQAKTPSQTVPEATAAELPATKAPPLEAQTPRSELQPPPSSQSSPRKQRLPEPSPAPFGQNQSPFSRPAPKQTYEEPQLPGLKQHSPQMSNRAPYQRQSSAPGPSASTFSSPGEHKAQPVRMQGIPGLSNDNNFLWGTSSVIPTHTPQGSNVWGPPTNNRHIGNGTFDTGYSRLSSGQLPQHQSAPFSNSVPFGRQYPPRMSPGSIPNVESRMGEPIGASQINGTSPLPETARPAYQPAPIAPPQKAGTRLQNQQPRDTTAWTTYAQEAHQRENDEGARLAAERRNQPEPQARWTETFKQTKMEDGWLGGPRKLVGKERVVHLPNANVSQGPPAVHDAGAPRAPHHNANPAPPISQTSTAHQMAISGGEQPYTPTESTVRLPPGPSSFNKHLSGAAGGSPLAAYPVNTQPLPAPPMTPTSAPQQSRFFPSALYGGSPPPEEADHPVFGDNNRHPQVRLPDPRPKVRLPPASSASQSKQVPVIMPQRDSSFKVGAQPLVANQDWQARFNGLFGRAQISTTTPPSPPRTPPKEHSPPPSVAAESKITMDFVLPSTVSTTVSLPQRHPQRFEAISKPGVDDMFDGELSFGSTPKVSLPRGVQYLDHFTGGNAKTSKVVDARSKGELPAYVLYDPKSEIIRMKIPQPWAIAKEIPIQRKIKSKPNPPARKASAKSSKPKQSASAANSNAASDLPKPASPASRGAGSRNTSFQTSQKSQSTVADQLVGTSSPRLNNQEVGGEEKENAPKKTSWAKPPKGPRGRGSGYKGRA